MATKPNLVQSKRALENLLLGTLSVEDYRTAIEAGKISGPSEQTWHLIDKANAMHPDDIRRAQGGRIEDRDIARYRKNSDVGTPSQEILDEAARFVERTDKETADQEAANIAAVEAMPLDEFLTSLDTETAVEPTSIAATDLAGTSEPATVEPPIELPEDKPVMEIIPYIGPNGDQMAKVINPDNPLENVHMNVTKMDAEAKALVAAERREELSIQYQGELVALREDELFADTIHKAQLLIEGQADRKLLSEIEDKKDKARQEGLDLQALDLLRQEGPGATAVAQAINRGAETVGTEGIINVGGKAVDFKISDEVLDFLSLVRGDDIALQTARKSSVTDDLTLGTRAATPLGEPEVLQKEILGRPKAVGQDATLPTDRPLGAAFDALNEGDQLAIERMSGVLGLDLSGRRAADKTAIPTGRGVFANFRRS